MTLWEKLRVMWRELNTPQAFHGDWYGALLNQAGHTALGAILAVLFATVCRMFFGEMPFRFLTIFAVMVPYLCVELFRQGWEGRDSAFDTAFVTMGACMIALPFYELGVDGDGTILLFIHSHFLMVFIVWLIVLFGYVVKRVRPEA